MPGIRVGCCDTLPAPSRQKQENPHMTDLTYATAHVYACPDGHVGPHGPLRMIVPDGTGLVPACTACGQPMTTAGDPLNGGWRVAGCCVPAGPGGRWVGPPRDPDQCTSCFGTRRRALCLACLAVNCEGRHAGCLACDATGTEDCPECSGDGHVYDADGQDAGLCPNPDCTAGRIPCPACGDTRESAERRV
jgi:hypothetical protein